MTDRRITLQLTPTEVGYITGALKFYVLGASGPRVGLVVSEINRLLDTLNEQITDDTLQANGLQARARRAPLFDPDGFMAGRTNGVRADMHSDDPEGDERARMEEYAATEAMAEHERYTDPKTCPNTGRRCPWDCSQGNCAGLHVPLNEWPE